MTELKTAQLELFTEGFMEVTHGSSAAYLRFRVVEDDQLRKALFDTGFNSGLALPKRDFGYLAERGLIRKVKENQPYTFVTGTGRARMG